jgi:hypothetical protein
MKRKFQNIILSKYSAAVVDPEISKGGAPERERGHPRNSRKIHVCWVSNLEFY